MMTTDSWCQGFKFGGVVRGGGGAQGCGYKRATGGASVAEAAVSESAITLEKSSYKNPQPTLSQQLLDDQVPWSKGEESRHMGLI